MFGTAGIVAILDTGIDSTHAGGTPELLSGGDVEEYGGVRENYSMMFAVVAQASQSARATEKTEVQAHSCSRTLESETISCMTSRMQSTSISTWFVVSAFLLALGLAVVLFSSACDQKKLALMSTGEGSEEPRQYFKVAIADMPINHYTHVEITGEVKSCIPEKDGDMHIQIFDGTDFVIAECIPKLPCSVIPTLGQTVTVRGISRYDRENRWYEIHPVEEIEIRK